MSNTKTIKITPLADRVLVESIDEGEQVKGGIIIPDSAKEKPQEYKVVAVGPGKLDDKGVRKPLKVKVGDIVLTSQWGGTEVKINDKPYKLVGEDDLLAIVR
ncbi:MAG: co-chaperone GroES [Puniceicoccales bacterium]|jgi:chaperonin GroES|nr:co-chaperone GroES [Puniceicoccales bacterium]